MSIEDDPKYWFNRGLEFFSAEKPDYKKTIECLEKCISLKPDENLYISAIINMGKSYWRLKEFDAAILKLKEVLRLDPKYLDALMILGIIYYMELNDLDAAQMYFLKSIKYNPKNQDPYHFLSHIYREKKDYKNCIKMSEKYIEIKPGSAEVWYNMGESYYFLKKYKKALEILEKAAKMDPEDSNIWYWLGRTQIQLTKYDDASDSFFNALKLNPLEINLWNQIALLDGITSIFSKESNNNVAQACNIISRELKNDQSDWVKDLWKDFQSNNPDISQFPIELKKILKKNRQLKDIIEKNKILI